MNRFQALFDRQQAFVAYLTAGQRGLAYTEQAALALIDGGVDILEIGVPFSDPVADGPTIQAAMNDALQADISLADVLSCIARIKAVNNVPVVLFTYYNPLYAVGVEQALSQMQSAGVDAVLVVDLPLEESSDFYQCCQHHGIMSVGLLAPSSDERRIQAIVQHDYAFLYYVCRQGITGVQSKLNDDYAQKIARIKSLTQQPVVAGFGIGDRDSAQQALSCADGFVVGSALIKAIAEGAAPEDLSALAKSIDPRALINNPNEVMT